ncbi:MAG: hypothetical protein WBE86_17245 [Candidatus Acidiferrales bacterium]
MNPVEQLVLEYLCRAPFVFANPQYSIKNQMGQEWSCPDFVTLNFREKIVSVVEVSVAASETTLLKRLLECETRWLQPLKAQLAKDSMVASGWSYQLEIFARRPVCEKLRREFRSEVKAEFRNLEDLGFYWQWDWPS